MLFNMCQKTTSTENGRTAKKTKKYYVFSCFFSSFFSKSDSFFFDS